MSRGDAIRALDHPYRQTILRILKLGRTAYSDLFSHLEPDGDDRGRFNYHLRSLRSADLIRLSDSLYGLTPKGEAALVLLREVSESSEARLRTRQEIRADERGWGRRVGVASRLRKAIHIPSSRTVGIALIIASIVGFGLMFAADPVIFNECTYADWVISCGPREWVRPNEAWVIPLRLFISLGMYWGGLLLAGGVVLYTRREAPQGEAPQGEAPRLSA